MTVSLGYALLGAAVLALSIYPLVLARDLLRRIVAANAFGTGIFLILVALGFRGEGATPDPTPHGLVLTGIIVAVSATGLALALAARMHAAGARLEDV